jgi:hypothetical protein
MRRMLSMPREFATGEQAYISATPRLFNIFLLKRMQFHRLKNDGAKQNRRKTLVF